MGGELEITCERAQLSRTNAGCEFWAADLPNAWLPSEPFAYDIASDQQFAVVVANTSETKIATVSAYSGSSNTALVTAQVGPLRTRTLELPPQNLDPTRNGVGTGYRVESDVPITAYQFQPLDNLVPVYSNDATSLLPSHVLENDYIALTSNGTLVDQYPDGFASERFSAGAFVTVVATEDDTAIDFFPTAALSEGPWNDIVLNRGQTFTILSEVFTDEDLSNLTGTRLITSAPVAVFSGNVIAGDPPGTPECCLDHVEHQLLPIAAWGFRYAVAPPPDPTDPTRAAPATYRITASFDQTELKLSVLDRSEESLTGIPTRINAGELVTFVTDSPVIVESDPEHPIAVGQFLHNSGELGGDMGDPAMIVVPAVAQLQTRYVFLAASGYAVNIVTVTFPDGANVDMDGTPPLKVLPLGSVEGTPWLYARWEVDPGAHIVNADREVGVVVVGYDEYVSYAFAGGTAVDLISMVPPVP